MQEFGCLFKVLGCTGIDIFESVTDSFVRKLRRIIRNNLFPLILHLNIIYLLWSNYDEMSIYKYDSILDTLMFILPCIIWWLIRRQKYSIKYIILQLVHFKRRRNDKKNSLIVIVNSLLLTPFLIILVMTVVNICSNENLALSNHTIHCRKQDFLRRFSMISQQFFIPMLFSILYFAICYNLTENFKYYKGKFDNLYNNPNEKILHISLREFLEVIKCAEKFSDLFSTPSFILLWQVFSCLSLVFLDVLTFEHFNILKLLLLFLTVFSLIGMTAIITFSASEISLKIASIRRILNDLRAAHLFRKWNTCNSETIDIILNRENVVLSACNVYTFDRLFVLKLVAIMIAHTVIYYQINQ